MEVHPSKKIIFKLGLKLKTNTIQKEGYQIMFFLKIYVCISLGYKNKGSSPYTPREYVYASLNI